MTQKTFRIDGAKITVYLDGPIWGEMPAATIGGFTCKTIDAGVQILDQALVYVRQNGQRRILGPMDGDTWHSYRVVTQSDNSPTFLLEPTAQPEVLQVLQIAGFKEISSYFSARVPLAQTAQTPLNAPNEFKIETWNGEQPEKLFEQVYDLSTSAFSKNAFYKPITRDAFMAMYMPMVPMLKPELIFFARRPDQSLAGFLFGTPNYAEGPKPNNAILKTYASLTKGAGQHLAYAFRRTAAALGYISAIHALIHDDNLSAVRSASEGADIFRRYGLFGLKIDD